MLDLERLAAASRALVDKLDEISANSEFKAVFGMAHVHGHNYGGPTWGVQLSELRNVLDEPRDDRCGGGQNLRESNDDSPGPSEKEEPCGEISQEGSRACGRRSGHEGPHAFVPRPRARRG